jgi:DNA-binding FadR family transcriptional regulator
MHALTETALRFSTRMTNRFKGVHRASVSDHKRVSDAILEGDAIAAEAALLYLMQEALDLIGKAEAGKAESGTVPETRPSSPKERTAR